jgi:nitrate/nitrite transporter NarK
MGWVSGILTMVHHIAGGVGALLGGSVFDQWGSYNQAFVMMFVLSLVALWASWALKSRTEPAWQPSTAPLQQDSDA